MNTSITRKLDRSANPEARTPSVILDRALANAQPREREQERGAKKSERWTDGVLWVAMVFLLTLGVLSAAFGLFLVSSANAQEVDAVTRQIGIEMLRERMIEQRAERERVIDWTPPGYFMVGYSVRAA